MTEPVIRQIRLTDIFVVGHRRPIKSETVEALAQSIGSLGLQHPLTIRLVEKLEDTIEGEILGACVLVAGAHRLAAGRKLGLETMPCRITEWNESQARRWEISENLHRAELTTLERAEQVAEWMRLTDAEADGISAQVAPKSGRGRPAAGINAASRELGIDRTEAQRATKIAGITPAAKAAARANGLDNNQRALLKVAAAPAEQQASAVVGIVAARKMVNQAKPRLVDEHDKTAVNDAVSNVIDLGRWLKPITSFEQIAREGLAFAAAEEEVDAPDIDMDALDSRAHGVNGAISTLDLVPITGREYWSVFGDPPANKTYEAWVRSAHAKITGILAELENRAAEERPPGRG